MTRTAHWTLGILCALYGLAIAVLLWLRQGNFVNLLIGTVMAAQAAWWLWGHRLRGGPPSAARGWSTFVLACAVISLLFTAFAMRPG